MHHDSRFPAYRAKLIATVAGVSAAFPRAAEHIERGSGEVLKIVEESSGK